MWGAFGQARLIEEVVEHCGSRIATVYADAPGSESPFAGVPIYCGWDQLELEEWIKNSE